MGEREHAQSALDKIEELRREANSKYFDVMLMHYQHVASWPTDTVR